MLHALTGRRVDFLLLHPSGFVLALPQIQVPASQVSVVDSLGEASDLLLRILLEVLDDVASVISGGLQLGCLDLVGFLKVFGLKIDDFLFLLGRDAC